MPLQVAHHEIPREIILNLYPNPTSKYLNIGTSEETVVSFVEIIDIQGKLVMSTKVSGGSTEIDVSNLPAGNYIIKAFTSRGIVDRKFIKQ